MKAFLSAILFIFVSATLSFAHGGGLDTYGCHHNRKQGGYHCHRGPLGGQTFSSKEEMLGVLQQTKEPREPVAPAPSAVAVKVVNVVDGDTIDVCCLEEKEERVRLIGVDTPETKDPRKPVQFFGEEAAAFTKRMVKGKRVRLEYDWERKDKYGRTLAYVYLEDGTFLNAEIIRQGYGFAYTRFPFKYLEEFRKYEREAREAGRGLWGQ